MLYHTILYYTILYYTYYISGGQRVPRVPKSFPNQKRGLPWPNYSKLSAVMFATIMAREDLDLWTIWIIEQALKPWETKLKFVRVPTVMITSPIMITIINKHKHDSNNNNNNSFIHNNNNDTNTDITTNQYDVIKKKKENEATNVALTRRGTTTRPLNFKAYPEN